MNATKMLDGKVVVVTGAGGGIGRDLALMAGVHGAKVVVNDIGASLDGQGHDDGPAERVAQEIRAGGGEAVASLDSVADAEGAQCIVRTAIDAFGRLDGIVNNAGILRDAFFHKMTEEEWDRVLKVHLYGSFHVSRAAAPVFKEQQSVVWST
jgi:NAD(P)-dependent dehydrogenase (short-subunit alcohol dehydrogenase family)